MNARGCTCASASCRTCRAYLELGRVLSACKYGLGFDADAYRNVRIALYGRSSPRVGLATLARRIVQLESRIQQIERIEMIEEHLA